MERKDLIWFILISVILAVIISFIIPILVSMPKSGSPQNPAEPRQEQPPQGSPPLQGQQEKIDLKILISFINIGLIIPLLIIYSGIDQKLRTSFTLGLMVVIFALGMYAITSNPMLVSLLGGRAGEIGVFQIIPDICATVALIILIRISIE